MPQGAREMEFDYVDPSESATTAQRITVEAYFWRKYKIRLQQPRLPLICVNRARGTYMPPGEPHSRH